MSFNPNLQAAFYTDLQEDVWEIIVDDDAEVSADGWDTKEMVLAGIFQGVTRSSQLAASPPDADTARGWIGYRPISEDNFWVQAVRFKCQNGAIWTAELKLKGLAASKNTAVRISNGTEQQQAANISTPGYGVVARLRNLVPTLEYERIYLHSGPLDFSEIGTAVTPPDAPDTPINPWSGLPDPEIRYPNGWVLSSRNPEYLTGVPRADAALVRDLFSYIFDNAP